MAYEKHRINDRDTVHERLMRSVLHGIAKTPMVLKGGTALMLGYGLDRFSEDLDFDSPQKLDLTSKLKGSIPYGISLLDLKTLKHTDTVSRYRLQYHSSEGDRSLKIEVSYRQPIPSMYVRDVDGFKVASLPVITDQKLKAAHDGCNPRSKVRDLFDLSYIARTYPAVFTNTLSKRLVDFASNPDALISRYRPDFEEDDLIRDLVTIDDLALNIHCISIEIDACIPHKIHRLSELNSPGSMHDIPSQLFKNVALDEARKYKVPDREINWNRAATIFIDECSTKGIPIIEAVNTLRKISPGHATPINQDMLIRQFSPHEVIHQSQQKEEVQEIPKPKSRRRGLGM